MRLFSIFIGLLVLLFVAELSWPAQHWVVQPWTALLQFFDPGVLAEGKVLRHAGSGVEACLMLVAALVAYPARWSARLIGIAVGLVAIQAVNLLWMRWVARTEPGAGLPLLAADVARAV